MDSRSGTCCTSVCNSALNSLHVPRCSGLLTLEAPLLDKSGKTAFFLGGQINCSTTVHSSSDIMRVLSTHDGTDQTDEPPLMPTPGPAKRPYANLSNRLRSFRGQKPESDSSVSRDAGMEQGLVNHIEKMKLKDQVDTFYTAYSKVRTSISLLNYRSTH